MDDLVAIGCGVIIGKILWWGIILVPAILWLHPWILLVALGIWWLVVKCRAEDARNMNAALSPASKCDADTSADARTT